MKKMKEKCIPLFQGEVTVRRRELWLIGAVCLFGGIIYGLKKASWTHGVTIGSYNGNGQGFPIPQKAGSEEELNCCEAEDEGEDRENKDCCKKKKRDRK